MKNLICNSFIHFICGALSTMVWCFPAHAESDGGDKWHFQLAPYAWLADQNGKVVTLPSLAPADIDVDFYEDILGNNKGALMLVGEARKGRYGLVMDVAYTDIETEDPTPLGILYSSDFMWDANINVGYQWTKTFSTTLSYRYLDVDYEDDGFLYDVAQSGLTLGLSWRFQKILKYPG